MSHKIWEINGLSLELDLQDADVNERCEQAFEAMEKHERELPKDGKNSERIRSYCKLFKDLFDDIFGSGTGDKLFENQPINVDAYEGVYFKFLDFIAAQRVGIEQKRNERYAKYKPVNRQQRRAKK
ncbi:MAG TPA: hypothetical protein P5191_09230 [Ruminococcus sp.]|nr:hypothetical protein [Ruminococcus sp.]